MSRSRKKQPFIGHTCAPSAQPWKAKAARAFRHAANQMIHADPEVETLPVKSWARVNPRDAPKDDKQRVTASWGTKWLRK
jgi:hypothetical protein